MAACVCRPRPRAVHRNPAMGTVVLGHLILTRIPRGAKAISQAAFAPQLLIRAAVRNHVIITAVMEDMMLTPIRLAVRAISPAAFASQLLTRAGRLKAAMPGDVEAL